MTKKKFHNIAHCWAYLIVEELARLQINHVCIAPGSRSTLLINEFSQRQDIQCYSHFDERSLGFFALGLAKGLLKPVAILTTSGTAVANLLPSIIEAKHAHIPLLILTTDRPFELHDCGANQTMDQMSLFSAYVNKQYLIPPATTDISPEWLLATCDEAVQALEFPQKGPIQLNFMIREPFFNQLTSFNTYLHSISEWENSNMPFKLLSSTSITPKHNHLPPSLNNCIAVIADIESSDIAHSIYEFCNHHDIPMFTECHSKLFGKSHTYQLIDAMSHELIKDSYIPEFILFFGDHLISKSCAELIKKSPHTLHITEHLDNADPLHHCTYVLRGSITNTLNQLSKLNISIDESFKTKLSNIYRSLQHAISSASLKKLSEITVLQTLFSSSNSKDRLFFIANSLPIRVLNHNIIPESQSIIYSNRGLSGIDGNLATAIGIAQATQKELIIIIGDISFLYDAMSLTLLQQLKLPLKICLLNNQGGQIFTTLPAQQHSPSLAPYFTTPHHLSMENLCNFFKLTYMQIENDDISLTESIKSFYKEKQSILFEYKFNISQTKQHLSLLFNTYPQK